MDETKASARLPGLDIEITHRVPREETAEYVSINMRATPSFAAFAGAVEPNLWTVMGLLPAALWQNWFDMARFAWAPWLALARPATRAMPVRADNGGG